MKEPTVNIFKSLVDLRLLLTSNFTEFQPGLNKISDFVEITWNGIDDKHEFKVKTVECIYEICYYGMPKMCLRGKIEEDKVNEIIIDSIFEVTQSINNWLNHEV